MNLNPRTGERGIERVLECSWFRGIAPQKLGAHEAESYDEDATVLDKSTSRKRRAHNIGWFFAHGYHRLSPLRHDRGGMLYGFNDGYVRSAAAQIGRHSRRGESLFNLRQGRFRIAFEQLRSLDHHPVLAEAALRSLLFDPGLLHRVKRVLRVRPRETLLLGPPRRQTFERGDLLVRNARDRRNARPRFLPIDQNRTSSALCEPATKLRPNQFEIVAQHIQKRSVIRRLYLAPDSIHIQRNHREPPSKLSEFG